jgi:hypothetical protein
MSQILRAKQLKKNEQFQAVSDEKLRLTLLGMADRYSEQTRAYIHYCYADPELNEIYRKIRASGVYQKGNLSNGRRKVIEFPNAYIYDFVNTVMTALYDKDWVNNNRALSHELVKPWLVVAKV